MLLNQSDKSDLSPTVPQAVLSAEAAKIDEGSACPHEPPAEFYASSAGSCGREPLIGWSSGISSPPRLVTAALLLLLRCHLVSEAKGQGRSVPQDEGIQTLIAWNEESRADPPQVVELDCDS